MTERMLESRIEKLDAIAAQQKALEEAGQENQELRSRRTWRKGG